MERKISLSSARAFANASSPHPNQSTGLWACCSRYGLRSRASRFIQPLCHPARLDSGAGVQSRVMSDLNSKRVAIFVEEGFEDRELIGPLEALRAAGATVTIVGPTAGAEFRGKRGQAVVTSDAAAGSVRVRDFDALVIPGGYAPDKMRMRHAMVDL